MLSDSEFLAQFEQQTLSPEYFDHRGHLRLAWLYLRREPLEDAITLVADGINKYASSLGATDKFQHTLTEAIVRIMAARMAAAPALNLDDFLQANADLVQDIRGVLLQYYSAELLFSERARHTWVAPDLAPLPETRG